MNEILQIVQAFVKAKEEGKKTALATVVHVEGSSYRRPGARMLVTEDGQMTGAISGGCLEGDALRKAALAIAQGKNKLVIYDTTDEEDSKIGIQLGCNGIVSILFEPIDSNHNANAIQVLAAATANRSASLLITIFSRKDQQQLGSFNEQTLPVAWAQMLQLDIAAVKNSGKSMHRFLSIDEKEQECFIEYVNPSISLIIVGAGNDAMPLVRIANTIGWNITLVDGRSTHATVQRFPLVSKLIVAKPKELLDKISLDNRTALVLMTHNYNYDTALLSCLQGKAFGYIGLLGPASKRERMLEELKEQGIHFSIDEKNKIFGPTGLNLGAETAEEIALSICSEIMATFNQANAIQLREKLEPIHQ